MEVFCRIEERLPEIKKAAVFAYTESGKHLKQKVSDFLLAQGFLIADPEMEPMDSLFYSCHLLVFIGACGIAVRKISPYVNSKLTDPAVIVMDENAEYIISLLSGHLGNANEWTRMLSDHLSGEAVITTATDVNEVFAIDDWAKENSYTIREPEMIRKISGALLFGQPVAVYLECLENEISEKMAEAIRLPKGLFLQMDKEQLRKEPLAIWIGFSRELNSEGRLCHLVPQDYVLGIGCRRGILLTDLKELITQTFFEYKLDIDRIGRIVSIDLKKEEIGLQRLSKELRVPFTTFLAEELREVKGDFSGSSFVYAQVGVDNVCERSACLGSGYGERILGKLSRDGMTLSVYRMRKDWRINVICSRHGTGGYRRDDHSGV